MLKRFWRVSRFAAAILIPIALVTMVVLNQLGMGMVYLPGYPPIAEQPYGDIAAHYDTRMAPLRQALFPDQAVGCCVDGLPTRESMRGALQLEAARFALLPARTGKAGESELVILDFDSEEELTAALPTINGDIVVRPGNGTGIVRLRPVPPAPASTAPATPPASPTTNRDKP
jgi:hypothetical protein